MSFDDGSNCSTVDSGTGQGSPWHIFQDRSCKLCLLSTGRKGKSKIDWPC